MVQGEGKLSVFLGLNLGRTTAGSFLSTSRFLAEAVAMGFSVFGRVGFRIYSVYRFEGLGYTPWAG